ncbi:MAG: hypothetical protein V5A43_00855 [Haloarculaceae archaeon]
MPEPGEPPMSGGMRCFVTWADRVDPLQVRVTRADPDYEWAIIGIERECEDYIVA